MKRSAIIIIASLLVGSMSQAHDFDIVNPNDKPVDSIYLLESTAPVEFSRDKTVEFSIDFSQAEAVEFDRDFRTVHNDMGTIDKYNADHGQSFVDDWPENLAKMTETACRNLKAQIGANFVSKGNVGNPDYRLVVRVGQFEFGHFVAMGGAKSGGTVTKGLAEVYDADNNLVAVYDINYLRGLNVGYGNNDRVREWGKNFAKEFKKALAGK